MDWEQLKKLPKVALHDHLDGGLRPKTVIDHLGEVGHEIPTRDADVLADWINQTASTGTLTEYLRTFDYTVAAMRTHDHMVRVAREAVIDLAADGVVYAELRYAPEQHISRGFNLPQIIEAVRDGLAQGMELVAAEGRTILARQILTSMRHGDPTTEIAELALEYRDEGVVGFDIAGAEDGFPAARFAKVFDFLRRNNFPYTIHAGEAVGPESVFEAVQLCAARRIGHGVRIIEDIRVDGDNVRMGRLAQYMLDQQVLLEVCPSSNLQTGIATEMAGHPVGVLYDLGFNISINCDNRLMSATTMSHEFALLGETFGWGVEDVRKVTLASMHASFARHDEKQRLIEDVILPGYAG
ncbi:MAG: adenosine deaminase [Propionibacterium sp.]|nr:adenosine deaminase [Propionibacterium sp.]